MEGDKGVKLSRHTRMSRIRHGKGAADGQAKRKVSNPTHEKRRGAYGPETTGRIR